MPRAKPKTCHKCKRMYTGWRCPYCYRKSAKASGARRVRSSQAGRRSFSASVVLGRAILLPVEAEAVAAPSRPLACGNCGMVTSKRYCPRCNSDVWRYGKRLMSGMGWLGFGLSTLALVLNAHHRRVAQVIFIAGNLMWLGWAAHQRLPEVIASQAVYLILNIRTLRAWLKERRVAAA
jgi:RNA polymerase subunit RPABC4/transcription elongation factor Spt4